MRIGVIGPVAPDRFAENISDALDRIGHRVTKLGSAGAFHRNRMPKGWRGLVGRRYPA